MTLTLNPEEARIVRDLLTRFVHETRSEIHHTDTASFKDNLKEQKDVAKALLLKLNRYSSAA